MVKLEFAARRKRRPPQGLRTSFPTFAKRIRANRANHRGLDYDAQGRTAEAITEYEKACRFDPFRSAPFYNLGLVYKYSGDWERSLHFNQRATELAPDDQAGWWNLGIAATALGRWDVARRAWWGAGVPVPKGAGPIDFPCGTAPIRLNPASDGEVVWSQRLDPARAGLSSIPLPESGFHFADVVPNDGAARGFRKLNGHDVPVFNCLQLLEASPFSTWVAQIELESPVEGAAESSMDLLVELALERDLVVENWSTSLRIFCKACSEGSPSSDHEHTPAETAGTHRVAIAARDAEQARALLAEWEPRSEGATVLTLDLALAAKVS